MNGYEVLDAVIGIIGLVLTAIAVGITALYRKLWDSNKR